MINHLKLRQVLLHITGTRGNIFCCDGAKNMPNLQYPMISLSERIGLGLQHPVISSPERIGSGWSVSFLRIIVVFLVSCATTRVASFHHEFAGNAKCWRCRFAATMKAFKISDQLCQSFPSAHLMKTEESEDRVQDFLAALRRAGFPHVFRDNDTDGPVNKNSYRYSFSKATGMLKLLSSPYFDDDSQFQFEAPRWIPIVKDEESVLVLKGWSFLDADDSDPLSPFDIDAANSEGLYRPKWGQSTNFATETLTSPMSNFGFCLKRILSEHVMQIAEQLTPLSRSVLLEGKTDPPGRKLTQNNFDFTGSARQSDIEPGIFSCAIGNLPLFTTIDVSPTTGSSGWLSFSQPVSGDHIALVQPEQDSPDQRIEVVCARTGCHLGHYFGKGDGYCINSSALNFIPAMASADQTKQHMCGPFSWRTLEMYESKAPSTRLLKNVLKAHVDKECMVFGAGCFWHVEFAFRRLPGVRFTEVGFAGGMTNAPTYSDVCDKETGHAEVVKVIFDPRVLDPRVLIDCFLALHDPTKVRAHGKHSVGSGQYRSCIFVVGTEMERLAHEALVDCSSQLGKELSTEVRVMDKDLAQWFWRAEERHQRHDERRKKQIESDLSTLSAVKWLSQYGKRTPSILGSTETMSTVASS